MKTAFKAKIIFESDKRSNKDALESLTNKNEFTFFEFANLLNSNNPNIKIECILDNYTNDCEPVIIIKEKEEEQK